MQIVIDIADEYYEYLKKLMLNGDVLGARERKILNGTPLPKWHGRLIDADELFDKVQFADFSSSDDVNTALLSIGDAPTIIEADKAESEG